MQPMSERRSRRGAGDSGARTRRTDHVDTPQGLQDWITTFNLRWMEYIGRSAHEGKPKPA